MSMLPEEPQPKPRGIGDNQPPSPIEFLVGEQREAHTPERAARLEYIVSKADAKKVEDRISAGDAGDIIKVAGEFEKLIDQERIQRTKPYRDAADAAKAACDDFLEPLRAAVERLRARLKQWSDSEDKRIAEQAAEQDAFFKTAPGVAAEMTDAAPIATPAPDRMVAMPAPSSKMQAPPDAKFGLQPAKRRKIVGDLGARVSQVERKVYRVVDVHAVPDLILNSSTVHEAIIQVAKAMSKHIPDLTGIEVTTENDNQIR